MRELFNPRLLTSSVAMSRPCLKAQYGDDVSGCTIDRPETYKDKVFMSVTFQPFEEVPNGGRLEIVGPRYSKSQLVSTDE